jgi:NADH dehydrogenase
LQDVNNISRILVTGAGGFIGKSVVAHLLKRGWKVRAVLRSPDRPFASVDPALEVVYADMRDRSALVHALQAVEVVVHLAAAKNDEQWSYDVNVGGAERLVEACRLTGCGRIINISTQSVKIARQGVYARTKQQADSVFESSGLAVTSLLPSVVYGEEMAGVFGTLAKLIRKLPVVPVLGDGRWICAPVYVGDVAEAVCRCIEEHNAVGKRYDIGGPDSVTFNDLIDRMARQMGVKRGKVHIPFQASLLAARFVGALLAKPPITVSNILGSNQDTHLNLEPARQDLGWDPIDFETGLRGVLRAGNPAEISLSGQPSVAELIAESILFTRYLISADPPQELIDRYVAANRTLFPDRTAGSGELRFVRRYPRALPLIDAAAGLLKPESMVRKKALLMTAVLEATPAYADYFLGRRVRPFHASCALVWYGIQAAVKITLGIPLFWIATRL